MVLPQNIVDVKKDTLCMYPEDVERYKKPNSELNAVTAWVSLVILKKVKKSVWWIYN